MKPRFSLTFTGLLLCSAALPCAASAPMTDFQRFTSYPFMERSYREAKKDNWAEVERLTRHVLGRVPNNDEARALLVEALAHQRRYKEAEALAEQLGDSPEHANALLELRLTWIEQDPPPASQVEQWLASSDGAQRVRLWQAYSLSLARFGVLPGRWTGSTICRHRATAKCCAWPEPTSPNNCATGRKPSSSYSRWPSKANCLRRTGSAWPMRISSRWMKRVERAVAQRPFPEAANQARLAMANRAIAVGQNQQARHWLQALPAEQLNQPEQRQQLWSWPAQATTRRWCSA